ncbi:cytochrome c1 [Sphingomicrobium sediminis]|uniref:Cytochrome c1 n=1 Tax=Sphingomicrobium sediminis TaxID=2950949 RepID=A0A9X2J1V5_9SPHN|nr:cytochrome c1 [Sphingomicrobium sediminis]MCM8557139.1 cytochrome c1 [Sphingomicrobium sediminis]
MGELIKFLGVRFFGAMIGLVFILVLAIAMITDLTSYFSDPPEKGAEYALHKEPLDISFASDGVFGRYDNAQLQRGFQVYTEVCSSCHGMEYVAFRNLEDIGYTADQVKVIASRWQVPAINEQTGEATLRDAVPTDRIPSPYANEVAGRAANNNAYPPDLSLIAKNREGGAQYLYSLLVGYQDPYIGYDEDPAELEAKYPGVAPGPGLYHNPYFPNLNLAMPSPISVDGLITYTDETVEPTKEQMAEDVTAFLIWAAEPKADTRKNAGLAVLIFLAFATVLAYLSYRQIWADAKRKVAPKGPLDPEHMAEREEAKDEAAEHGRGVKG